MIHKAQEILIHYNESKKSFTLKKKESRKSVKKSSEKLENYQPSYSKDTLDQKNFDKKSNDQNEFKITSVSDNEIILKNKEKFLNVLQDITEQMNKRFSQMPSKVVQQTIQEEIRENLHYYSNIDHIKSDERTFQNLCVKENENVEKNNIFGDKNYKQEDDASDINRKSINIINKEENKDSKINNKKIINDDQEKKNKKACSCYCLII